jgi:hypothetical protein
MFDELFEQADVVDCLMEIHSLRESVKNVNTERLVSFIMDSNANFTVTDQTTLAIQTFFNTGKVTPKNRTILENCYVLLNNDMCWGESDHDWGVFQTLKIPY